MCGIAGAFSLARQDANEDLVRSIIASQYRRGPDHQAVERVTSARADAFLGHNRLSILDLTPEANQPMWDSTRRYGIVFNGEIYNYIELKAELEAQGRAFRTRSDTEVLLKAFKAWGPDAFASFNGMFAFGLLDREEERLWLVRDRFGVKPLYYYAAADRLLFASTCATLARRLGLPPSLEYAARGLQYGLYDADEIAPFDGLKAVRPGYYVEVSQANGTLRLRADSYYCLPERVTEQADAVAGMSLPEMTDRLTHLLESAIDLRFRADVPVGVSLSGGLDSSTIAAFAARRGQGEVIGFTLGHPDEPRSEGPPVQKLSKQANIRVHYIRTRPAAIAEAYRAALEAQEAPFPNGSIVGQYLVFQEARAAGIKVLLGGQGGDELFMGYRKYQLFRLLQLLHRNRRLEALGFLASLAPQFAAELPMFMMYWHERRRFASREGAPSALRLPPAQPVALGFDPSQPLWRRQMSDVYQLSLPTLLRYEDRNSMGHSVESRLPFLDYRLMEFALALPDAAKLQGGFGKWIVREAARGIIPESIRRARYKRGFDVAQTAWIDDGLGAGMRAMLRASEPAFRQWLPVEARIDQMFSDAALKRRPAAFLEATTLIWLGAHAR